MKSIATVNCQLPTIESYIDYNSNQSLLDYDIILFDPSFPYLNRIQFSSGGSCISIEGTKTISQSLALWRNEIIVALKSGKTVFFLLNHREVDDAATGVNSPRKGEKNYSTTRISNYSALPIGLAVRNATGKKFKAHDANFKQLFEALEDIAEYRVIVTSGVDKQTFLAQGDNVVGAWLRSEDFPGHLVLLPYFDLSEMTEATDDDELWTEKALRVSRNIASQLIAVDGALNDQAKSTPQPGWLEEVSIPKQADSIQKKIDALEKSVVEIRDQIRSERERKAELLRFTDLLFENGDLLERAIERTLKVLGYNVSNYREGALEFDHVIIGPSNVRMIGETEGKDNAAVSISKFRQLESNINEDFERDEVTEPAKGLLFGNGYRLTSPEQRGDQFADKCLTNARRLGTALIKTSDLYRIVVHLLDHPEDEIFKEKCRKAIEATNGEVVQFPDPD